MTCQTFAIAAFDAAGVLIGTNRQASESLSEKWIGIASDFLSRHGRDFRAAWPESLGHLSTRFSSSNGVALVSFYAKGILVASIVLLNGQNSAAEISVLRLFVSSLRKADVVSACSMNNAPFDDVFNIEDRPLMVVVPWGDDRISEQDQGLVQELVVHLSAAYFLDSG